MKKRKGLSEIFALIFDPKIPILFILGAIALAVIGNGAYDLLLAFLGSSPTKIMYIIVGTLAILIGTTAILWSLVRSRLDSKEPISGLIVLVSPQTSFDISENNSIEKIIIEHHIRNGCLTWCGLVSSSGAEDKTKMLSTWLINQNIESNRYTVYDEFDEDLSYEAVNSLFSIAHQILKHRSILVDVTRGTKLMTVGAIKACIENDLPLQVMKVPHRSNNLAHAQPHRIAMVASANDDR